MIGNHVENLKHACLLTVAVKIRRQKLEMLKKVAFVQNEFPDTFVKSTVEFEPLNFRD
jgi:hypothetical protein